jgi:hypothetical protein
MFILKIMNYSARDCIESLQTWVSTILATYYGITWAVCLLFIWFVTLACGKAFQHRER